MISKFSDKLRNVSNIFLGTIYAYYDELVDQVVSQTTDVEMVLMEIDGLVETVS